MIWDNIIKQAMIKPYFINCFDNELKLELSVNVFEYLVKKNIIIVNKSKQAAKMSNKWASIMYKNDETRYKTINIIMIPMRLVRAMFLSSGTIIPLLKINTHDIMINK